MATVWSFPICRRAASWLAVISSTCGRITATVTRDGRVAVVSSLPGEQRRDSLSRKVSGPKLQEKSFCCSDSHPHPVWRRESQDLVGIWPPLGVGSLQEGGGACGNGCLSPLFTILGLAWAIHFPPPFLPLPPITLVMRTKEKKRDLPSRRSVLCSRAGGSQVHKVHGGNNIY